MADEEDEVPFEERLSFFALANTGILAPLTCPGEHATGSFSLESEPIPLVVHPALMQYLLKLDIVSQPPDHDFGLPTEELLSSAVHPPVLTLILEPMQGYLQKIEVQASDKGSRVGVTVEDVLKMVGAHFRLASIHREWSRPPSRVGREPKTKTRSRCIDYLSGRNRLQIFPMHPLLTEHKITQPLPPNGALRVFHLHYNIHINVGLDDPLGHY